MLQRLQQLEDPSVTYDVVAAGIIKGASIDLECVLVLLPLLTSLLDSTYEDIVLTAMRALSHLSLSFGPLIKNATETWKIAFAHHPYLSNGKHGNAGQYEGLPFIPIVSGDGVKKDYEAILCGKVDLLISGHDHSRQWVKASAKCQGVEFFVAGAGASTTEIKSKSLLFTPSPVWFEDASVGGFLWIELKGKHLKGEFWDENGKLSYTREYDKP